MIDVTPGINKVSRGGLAGAAATAIVGIAQLFGIPVPPGVEGALATLFAVGLFYYTKETYQVKEP